MLFNSQEFGDGNVPRVKTFLTNALTLIAPDVNGLWRKPNVGLYHLFSPHCDALTSGVKRDGQARDIFIINQKEVK